VVVLGALNFLTKRTLEPIPPIVAMCKKIIAGDLTARVGIRPGGEMGVLCEAVDRMADAVSQREAMLQQTTRQQLGQSEKLASIGRLAAGIAHEINNPLTGVLTFAHLLKEREDTPPGSRGDLDVIIRETTRVREIVRGLLDFARQSAPAKEQLDINDVIRRTMQLLRSQKDFRKITIEESLDDKLPRLLGDKNQLQQVFLNLSLNALEAMPEGGLLRVETNVEHDRIRIVFADTGIGIKEQDLEQIFDPFFTTKPVGKGTGLGLSVSYGTIQQHGGSIEVESEEGRGTLFTILLPLNGRGDSGSITRRET
jgi:signal transduction histidine kinase